MHRTLYLVLTASLGVVAAEPPTIGKVVKVSGQWQDNAYSGAAVGLNYGVRANSLLERKKDSLSDKDLIWIEPRGGGPPVQYECKNGMTCVGPLVLCRVPASPTSIAILNKFLDWRKREECLGVDYTNVKAMIHRAPAGSRPAILVAREGRVPAAQLFEGEVPKEIREIEFCRVRPGTVCPVPVKAVKVRDSQGAASIPLAPGFYKAVVIEDQRRTQDQWYILVVKDDAAFQRLNELYGEAARAAHREASEESISQLIAYLYYLSEAAAHDER